MSKKHLDDLQKELFLNKWEIISEDNGDNLSISGYWTVFNVKYHKELKIAFDGIDDLSVLPMDKCYACHIDSNRSLSLYFSKNNAKEWKVNLLDFVATLDEYASNFS